MKPVVSATLLAGVMFWCAGDAWVLAELGSDASIEALRWAKQAEASGVARDHAGFVEGIERALKVALEASTRNPDHRLAEGVQALTEARALGREGNLAEGREDLQSAIVWLTRAVVLPAADPSADSSMNQRDPTSLKGHPARAGKERAMDHFLIDIEEATTRNDNFRQVLFTASHSQLVLMSLKPGEEIGTETHHLDQFIRVEAGRGSARLNGKDYALKDGSALVIPAGTEHNIINDRKDQPLKLYTIYSPPEHKDGVVHRTKQEAEADHDDHFDGKTTALLHESQKSR